MKKNFHHVLRNVAIFLGRGVGYEPNFQVSLRAILLLHTENIEQKSMVEKRARSNTEEQLVT